MGYTTVLKGVVPIQKNRQIMSGASVFTGTIVDLRTLFDYLVDGCSLVEFLDNFPTVKKEQAEQILELAFDCVLEEAEAL